MIFLTMIPLAAIVSAIFIGLFFLRRRQQMVEAKNLEIKKNYKAVLANEQNAFVKFWTELTAKDQVGKAIRTYRERRGDLVVDFMGEPNPDWSSDELKEACDSAFSQAIQDVNRRLALPLIVALVLVVAAATTTEALIYNRISGDTATSQPWKK